VDAHGMPVRAIITKGKTADCTQGIALIDNICAGRLLAERGYDSNAILYYLEKAGMKSAIPPKRDCKIQRDYDKELYKVRKCFGVLN
jgi:transposase